MKKFLRSSSLLLLTASLAYGGIPPITVTVSSGGGKASFKGVTDSNGTFATSNLPAGNYTVQFNANAAAVKGQNYSIVVSAGTKKVSTSSVAGEKLIGGGVAMKLDVGSNLNITGQVAATRKEPSKKKMVWIQPMTGSHLPGHWVEEGSAEEIESRTRSTLRKDPTATGGLKY